MIEDKMCSPCMVALISCSGAEWYWEASGTISVYCLWSCGSDFVVYGYDVGPLSCAHCAGVIRYNGAIFDCGVCTMYVDRIHLIL